MIGAVLTGLVAGTVGRLLVPDMWSGLHGPKSWLFSLLLGLAGALLGYLVSPYGSASATVPSSISAGSSARSSA